MALRTFPSLASDLIKDLEVKYPPRCIQPDESLEAHLRYAGACDAVAWLKEWQFAADKLKR